MPEITRDLARSLVSEFTSFTSFPPTQEGLRVTIDTLIACARSEAHAKRIVREIVECPGDKDNPKWPTPDRIRSVAWSLLAESEKASGCNHCGGSGWVHSTRLIKGVPYDCAAPCSCRAPAPPEQPAKRPVRDGRMASAAEVMEDNPW